MKIGEKLTPVLVILVVFMGVALGALWQKVRTLEKNGQGGSVAAVETTQQTPAPQISINQIKDLFGKDLIKFGDGDKKLLLVEIGDPSCPYCHVASGLNPEINAQMGPSFKLVSDGGTYLAPVPEFEKLVQAGKASFVYIYTPGHGNGEMGTKAMYCAYEKGKFWQVHDKLMTKEGYDLLNNTVKNDKAQSGTIADFLKSAMSATEMKSCLDSGKYDSRITEDVNIAQGLGVSGTPGFFVNTTRFSGAYSWTQMESAVNTALGI